MSVPSSACRSAVVRRLRGVLPASTALCPAALPAVARGAARELNPTAAGLIAAILDFNADANWSPAPVPTGTARSYAGKRVVRHV
ncbi:hypothetical protein [Bradyrhizobium sp. 170]|uniref:hypothetical protein n=1 Tax=Bradyrhizobium sp. 170 TaxID=2782641 RepID=UPI001FFEB74D|nr:hypothetical protein [Bradyrhizobium sp. 170]UPK03628.1 hypothetical protein IVB05_40080 [Bradyrhizobium sp. 170]